MRIAIVDDEAAERDALARRLDAQLSRLGREGEILTFGSGECFLDAAGKRRFDLAFLDIYMGTENGIDTAKALRRFDTDCLLVFSTTSRDHALEGFRVRAVDYLVKPYSDEALAGLLDELVARLPAPDKILQVSSLGRPVRLRFSDILYAEHYKHQIHIHTKDGEIIIRQTFREFTESLTDDRFFLCSRGVILNLEHAADFDGVDFVLENGCRVPVSRDLAKAARSAFGDYLFKRGPKP